MMRKKRMSPFRGFKHVSQQEKNMSEDILMNIADQIRRKVSEANDDLENSSIREDGEDFLYTAEMLAKELQELTEEMFDLRREMNI